MMMLTTTMTMTMTMRAKAASKQCGLPAHTVWCSNAAAGSQPAPIVPAALVLKCRCGLPACTAWKQLWCSNGANPHRLDRCGQPARTAYRLQAWCSSAIAGCQAASLHWFLEGQRLLQSSSGWQSAPSFEGQDCFKAVPASASSPYSLSKARLLQSRGG